MPLRVTTNGMAVSSVLASQKKKRRKGSGVQYVGHHRRIPENTSQIECSIADIDEIIQKYESECMFAESHHAQDEKGSPMPVEYAAMQGLLKLAESRLNLKSSYWKLGCIAVFGIIYVLTLFLQRDVESAFGIETR